jgi:hypothetical protein
MSAIPKHDLVHEFPQFRDKIHTGFPRCDGVGGFLADAFHCAQRRMLGTCVTKVHEHLPC